MRTLFLSKTALHSIDYNNLLVINYSGPISSDFYTKLEYIVLDNYGATNYWFETQSGSTEDIEFVHELIDFVPWFKNLSGIGHRMDGYNDSWTHKYLGFNNYLFFRQSNLSDYFMSEIAPYKSQRYLIRSNWRDIVKSYLSDPNNIININLKKDV